MVLIASSRIYITDKRDYLAMSYFSIIELIEDAEELLRIYEEARIKFEWS
ncbi:MAG: hypothetical protein ACTSRU_17875 [Candidatus Hodarchaeales archaeon]